MNKFLLGSLNLSKIPKEKIKEDRNGNKWLDITIWFNEEPDQYGNNLSVQVSAKKDEPKVYIGNAKFYVPKEDKEPPKAKEGFKKESDDGLPF
jgi:hypothetical protein